MVTPSPLRRCDGSRLQVRLFLALLVSLVTVPLVAQQWPNPTGNVVAPINSGPDVRLANGGIVATELAGDSNLIWRAFQSVGVIIAITGIAIVGFMLLRRFAPGVIPGTDARMKVLTRMPIGNRQSMIVVRVGERVLVVGASPGRIECLSEITDFDEVQDLSYGFEFSSEIQRVRNDVEEDQHQVVNVEDSTTEDIRDEIQWLRERLDGYGDRVEGEKQT